MIDVLQAGSKRETPSVYTESKNNVRHQADDDQLGYSGQALHFCKCVAGCLATSLHLVSVHQQVYTLKSEC